MVIEKGIEGVTIAGGFVIADVKLKTEKGIVGSRFSFEIRRHPKLDALVTEIDRAITETMAESVGVVAKAETEPAKA